MSAVTPTATPPVEITVFNEAVREFRRLRRYRREIRHSSFEGQRKVATDSRHTLPSPDQPRRQKALPHRAAVTTPPAASRER
jgi:hypothetical protein